MYMTVKQAAGKWDISDRRIRALCAAGKIRGPIRRLSVSALSNRFIIWYSLTNRRTAAFTVECQCILWAPSMNRCSRT